MKKRKKYYIRQPNHIEYKEELILRSLKKLGKSQKYCSHKDILNDIRSQNEKICEKTINEKMKILVASGLVHKLERGKNKITEKGIKALEIAIKRL